MADQHVTVRRDRFAHRHARLDILKYPNSVSGSTASSAGADSERLRVKHNYNATGYLTSVSDAASSTVYWTAVSNSAGGAILREDLGNGLSTLRGVDRATGRLSTLTTGAGVSATVQNLGFTWDGAGNLKARTDNQANKREEFDYDGLYRLTQSRLYATAGGTTASSTDNYTYDAIGNLTNKGGTAGAYTYSGYNYGTRTGCSNTTVKPHAVYQVTVGSGTRRYCYDANGNLTNQTIASGTGTLKYDSSTWWVANLAKRISYGGSTSYSDFWYGAGRERIRQVGVDPVSWTPHRWSRRSSRWQQRRSGTRRSSSDRWSVWSAQGGRRLRCRRSSGRRPGRLDCGSSSPRVMPGAATAG